MLQCGFSAIPDLLVSLKIDCTASDKRHHVSMCVIDWCQVNSLCDFALLASSFIQTPKISKMNWRFPGRESPLNR